MSGRLRRGLADRLSEPTLRRIQRIRHAENPVLEHPVARQAQRGVIPAIVSSFDAHAVRDEVVTAVTHAFERAGIPYVLLPGARGSVRQVAVTASDRFAAMKALETSLRGPGWVIGHRGPSWLGASVLPVHRVLAAPGGQILCDTDTTCEVGFWETVVRDDVPRADGEPHLPGTRLAPTHNGVVGYLTEQSWERAVSSPRHWPVADRLPDIFDVNEPVDLVYTWVDGSDPVWRERMAMHAPGPTSRELNFSATRMARFTNRDELRFSMRSVAMYANWIRTIYVVTDGQVPGWLDTSHPKIVLVDHRDIFRDQSALPVFNSHAIESQLHHIDGLSEHYLYLNDDVFFGRPVYPELFFHANGIKKFFVSRDTIDLDPPGVRDLPVMSAAKNHRALMEADFGVTLQRKIEHAVHPQLRSMHEEMEKLYPDLYDRVSRSRFRHPADVSVPSALHHYYSYARGQAVPAHWLYTYQDLTRSDTPRRLDAILRRRPQVFCLNDMDSSEQHLAKQIEALDQFFGEYFPVAAPWERGAGRSLRSVRRDAAQ